jgi:hypothetical protein
MMSDEDINQAVFETMTAKLMDYCERRTGQGVTREQLNSELKDLVPEINTWSQRQRTLMKLTVEMALANTMTRQ